MASLKQLIQRHVNPFDPTTFKPGNFWQEQQNSQLEVTGIHQDVLVEIDRLLDQIIADRVTRTLLLAGDSGSGKSHLLGRLKQQFNDKAFFAYIGPWADSDYLWRHTLRNTVDSLIHVPDGKAESQLLLWLTSLPSLKGHSLVKWVMGERRTFISDLKASFPTGIYNAKEFFGVLYDLATKPDLRLLAYDWLRGDDLDEEDLKALRVKQSIDSEDRAQKILGNFGRISASTQPIVLCFDNLDNIPLLANGKPDFQSLFNVNSAIHNEKLSNFLVLISIITSTWVQNRTAIQPADVARINQHLALKPITLDQAEALWATRLAPLHAQAKPKPKNAIAPLTIAWLQSKFPGGKTRPRNTLMLGQQLIEQFKRDGKLPSPPTKIVPSSAPSSPAKANGRSATEAKPPPVSIKPPPPPPNRKLEASFDLVWQREFQKVQKRITRIGQLSSPDLIRALREVLEALDVPGVRVPFLKGSKYGAYSVIYEQPVTTGVIWTEDRNLTSFYHVMNACQRAIDQGRCKRLYLIRSEHIGRSSNKGNQLYRQIFAYANYLHVYPDLPSVWQLETYHSLVNAACGGELVVERMTPDLAALQHMVRQAGVFASNSLLQELELLAEDTATTAAVTPANTWFALPSTEPTPSPKKAPSRGKRKRASSSKAKASRQTNPAPTATANTNPVKQYLLNLITTQHLMGLEALIQTTQGQFAGTSDRDIEALIDTLCRDNQLQILDPNASREEQLICLVPSE
ncbi:MAG: ATP-binding protein [Cyanobacteria bacterium P01_A01_bin.123]